MDLSCLNEPQKEAVRCIDGPVMVIAGAGSGKTRVLTHRVAYLIEQGIPSQNILAVTFTNKAAGEMKQRIATLVGENIRSWISTFHSFGAHILRRYLYLFGYTSSFTIIDEDDSLAYVKEAMKALDIDTKQYAPKLVRSFISKRKNVDSFIVESGFQEKFDQVFDVYNATLKNDNVIDFDDILVYSYRLFSEYPDILGDYQNLYQYILVDEFQDTNDLQYRIVKLLADRFKNIFIVGDQDQSIYSFRGANVGNIDLFLHDFKDAKRIVLSENYRSTEQILYLANSIINKNKARIPKDLYTSSKGGSLVRYKRMQSSYEEVDYVASEIKCLVREGYNYGDIAIFYRANAMSRGFEEVFMKYNLPYQIWGGVSFFSRMEIKDLIGYLRLLVDIKNKWAFKRVINVPKRGIGLASIKKVEDHALERGLDFFEASIEADISSATRRKILDFQDLIKKMQGDLLEKPLEEFVDYVIKNTGYLDMLKSLGDEGEDRLDNIKEFKSVIANAIEVYEGSSFDKLSALLEDIALFSNQDQEEKKDSVKMMTFHQAKGLEFDVVFMVAMENGIFPLVSSMFDNRDLEEERRVCYVGITRAKKILYLTNTEIRRRYGKVDVMAPSMFINEMDFQFVDDQTNQSIKQKQKFNGAITRTPLKPATAQYAKGDEVKHQVFGHGVVKEIHGDTMDVLFDDYGTKTLLAAHPSIRKMDKPVIAERPANRKEDYLIGDVILHKQFGEGIVKEVGETTIKVQFSSDLVKLVKGHNSYEKISNYKVGSKYHHEEFGDGVIIRVDGAVMDIAFKAPYGIKKIYIS